MIPNPASLLAYHLVACAIRRVSSSSGVYGVFNCGGRWVLIAKAGASAMQRLLNAESPINGRGIARGEAHIQSVSMQAKQNGAASQEKRCCAGERLAKGSAQAGLKQPWTVGLDPASIRLLT
jgi:hypothetical protein